MNAAALEATGELAASFATGEPKSPSVTGPSRVTIVEHKTSSEDIGVGSMYWRKLQLDAQISNYLVGARALGFEPDGVLYDILRKPAQRPLEVNSKRKEPETPQEYFRRLFEDICSRPEHYYQRGVVVRLESEERDAAHDTWMTADMIRVSRNSGRWPRNVDACSNFNRLCEYWEVCSGQRSLEDPLFYERTESHPELDGKHRLPLLTSSSARTFRACARKYQFAYELGIRPKEKAGNLRFGQRIHKALESWMTDRDLDLALAAMASEAYDYDAAKAEAMIRGYHARWLHEPLEILAVETEFVSPLINPETGAASRTFMRAGKIDAIAKVAA